jgi:adenine-specific DNA-methyltransferase
MRNLFPEADVFSFPKPSTLIQRSIKLGADSGIILDFFSGSATTAHAVMQLNAEDGGNRKFILVQLPEVCAEDSEAAKAGYKNICEIGKERIRRAGKKIREEIIQRRDAEAQSSQSEEADLFSEASLRSPRLCDSALKTNPTVDIGFRVLKIDSSSLDDVSATVGETNQMMFDKLERIKSDRTPEDILFQLLIETHIPLSDPIVKVKVGANEVFFVGVDTDESLRDSASPRENYMDAPLVACLDRSAKLTNEFFLELAAFKPGIVFFRDDAFNDDAARINVEQIFKQNSPNTIVKVI